MNIQENELENVCTVTHQSNGMNVKSNGTDSNGMDISVFFKEITHMSQQTWWPNRHGGVHSKKTEFIS